MRKLKPEEIECRVSQVKEKGCTLLLYKTARVDRAILDEEFGEFNWQNDFKIINGNMYGGIGIKHDNEWIWRWDCGTPNKTEVEKSEASDCFKRAGFKWGIGVELYTAPFIWINTETVYDNIKKVYKLKNPFTKYIVKDIFYSENGDIKDLTIIDDKNIVVFKKGTKITNTTTKKTTNYNDIDILEGLKACDTASNAKSYYKQYESKVINIESFKDEYLKVWKELKAKEKANG